MSDGNFTNRNRGYLSRNSHKQPETQQPDFVGKLDVDGTSYEVAGWEKGEEWAPVPVAESATATGQRLARAGES